MSDIEKIDIDQHLECVIRDEDIVNLFRTLLKVEDKVYVTKHNLINERYGAALDNMLVVRTQINSIIHLLETNNV